MKSSRLCKVLMLPVAAMAMMAVIPAPESLRDRIVADARTMSATSLTFDRTTILKTASPLSKSTVTKVERWDGKVWTLISIDGRTPRAGEAREAQKLAAETPTPGYHRLASYLSGATQQSVDSAGHIVLHIAQLPAGTISNGDTDLSAHLMADMTIGDRNGQPWVQKLKVTAREPFRMGGLIKVTTFEMTSDFKLDPNGRPRLSLQVADSVGSMFGQTGGQSSETTYAYR